MKHISAVLVVAASAAQTFQSDQEFQDNPAVLCHWLLLMIFHLKLSITTHIGYNLQSRIFIYLQYGSRFVSEIRSTGSCRKNAQNV